MVETLDRTLSALAHRPFLTRTNGAFFRTPDGGSETMAKAMAPDLDWFALNIGDGHRWADWNKLRSQTPEVEHIPWRRCWNPEGLIELLDVADLFDTAYCIPNIESEFEDTLPPALVADIIENHHYIGAPAFSSLGWLQNSPDFSPLTSYPFLLQVFWEDMRFDPALMQQKQRDCVYHARDDHGITYVGVTYMTVRSFPSFYAYRQGPRSYYTGDDCAKLGWDAWRP